MAGRRQVGYLIVPLLLLLKECDVSLEIAISYGGGSVLEYDGQRLLSVLCSELVFDLALWGCEYGGGLAYPLVFLEFELILWKFVCIWPSKGRVILGGAPSPIVFLLFCSYSCARSISYSEYWWPRSPSLDRITDGGWFVFAVRVWAACCELAERPCLLEFLWWGEEAPR